MQFVILELPSGQGQSPTVLLEELTERYVLRSLYCLRARANPLILNCLRARANPLRRFQMIL